MNNFYFFNFQEPISTVPNLSSETITCRKLIIDKNGNLTFSPIEEDIKYNSTINSIQFKESFIIYDCWNEIENDNVCKFNYNEEIIDNSDVIGGAVLECNKKEVKGDKDNNICCYYRIKFKNGNKTTGCLEINKYEFQRFRWALTDDQFDNNTNYNDKIIEIECKDKINKINNFYILLFLIIFFNL